MCRKLHRTGALICLIGNCASDAPSTVAEEDPQALLHGVNRSHELRRFMEAEVVVSVLQRWPCMLLRSQRLPCVLHAWATQQGPPQLSLTVCVDVSDRQKRAAVDADNVYHS